jgi:hypothetical protein
MLAGVGVGAYADVTEAVRKVVCWSEAVVDPDPRAAAGYERGYEVFKGLYSVAKDVYPDRE